jgi:hypothetical protein
VRVGCAGRRLQLFPMDQTMIPYKNLGGDSGVDSYAVTGDSINVRFTDGMCYLYTYRSAGKQHVDTMAGLAAKGQGLNSYINKYVRKLYASHGQC